MAPHVPPPHNCYKNVYFWMSIKKTYDERLGYWQQERFTRNVHMYIDNTSAKCQVVGVIKMFLLGQTSMFSAIDTQYMDIHCSVRFGISQRSIDLQTLYRVTTLVWTCYHPHYSSFIIVFQWTINAMWIEI